MRTIISITIILFAAIGLTSGLQLQVTYGTGNTYISTPTPKPTKIISPENVSQLKEFKTLEFDANITAIEWGLDDKYLAIGLNNGELQLFDFSGEELVNFDKVHTNRITALAFDESKSLMLSADVEGNINIWDLETFSITQSMVIETDEVGSEQVSDAVFRPETDQILLSRPNGTVEIRQLEDGGLVHSFSTQQTDLRYYATSIVFSADTQWVASMKAWNTIEVWDVVTEEKLFDLAGHSADMWSLDFSSDNSILASGSDDYTIRLWDMSTGANLHVLEGHEYFVRTVRFSPDDQLLVSVGLERTMRFWETSTGIELLHIQLQEIGESELKFNQSGQTIALALDDQISFWEIADDVIEE